MQVFVYGALMADPRLEHGQHGWVEAHALRFTARGFTFLEPRFLALEASPGDTAHGVVAEVSATLWQQLTSHEDGYEEREVRVHTATASVPAQTLVLLPAERVDEGSPSGRYADILVTGATRFGLPQETLERYERAAANGTGITRRLRPVVAVVKGFLSK